MEYSLRPHYVEEEEYSRLGLLTSILGHLIIFALVFFKFSAGWGDFQKPVVYSVTLEGGKKLGGISQVPDEKKKTMIAPPKNTSAKEQPQQKIEPQNEPLKKEEAKIPEAEKGEVQIKKKEVEEKKEVKKPDQKKTKGEDKPKPPEKFEDMMQRYLGESSAAGGTTFGAGALGGKGMGGGTLLSPEHLDYLNKIRRYVQSGFFWNDKNAKLACDITFSISMDGKISDPVIAAGSGNRAYDDAAMTAVRRANPLPAPLASFFDRLNPVTIHLTPQNF